MLTHRPFFMLFLACVLLFNAAQSAWAAVHHELGPALPVVDESSCHDEAEPAESRLVAQTHEAQGCCGDGLCLCSCAVSASGLGLAVPVARPPSGSYFFSLASGLPQALVFELLRPPSSI